MLDLSKNYYPYKITYNPLCFPNTFETEILEITNELI